MTTIPFRKMNGLGNDFAVVDARAAPVRFSSGEIAHLADRSHGIGFDQLVTIERSPAGADAFMRIHNADGGEVSACGNAARCVAFLLFAETGEDAVAIETRAGLLKARAAAGGNVAVDMGRPKLAWNEIPLAEPFHDTRRIELQIGPIDAPILHSPSCVNMGNPHAIFWVDDPDIYDLARIGPLLENHPIFPERANISLAAVPARDAIRLRTWERGAGLTRACGTAACAALVAAARLKRTDRRAAVTLPGGSLRLEWREDDRVIMTGPAEVDYDGDIDRATLAVTRFGCAAPRGVAAGAA